LAQVVSLYITGHFQSPLAQLLRFLLHLIVIFNVPQGSVLGPILLTIYFSPIASIVSSHGVNQQHYADDTQLSFFISPASLSSSLCSLQRCVSSLHSWFLHNGLVLNPTKIESICFGTNPRLKSLSTLTSIAVADSSVPL